MQQCFSRLLGAETVNSNWLQQGGSGIFHVTGSSEAEKPPDVSSGLSGILLPKVLRQAVSRASGSIARCSKTRDRFLSCKVFFLRESKESLLKALPTCGHCQGPVFSLIPSLTVRTTSRCLENWMSVRSDEGFKIHT